MAVQWLDSCHCHVAVQWLDSCHCPVMWPESSAYAVYNTYLSSSGLGMGCDHAHVAPDHCNTTQSAHHHIAVLSDGGPPAHDSAGRVIYYSVTKVNNMADDDIILPSTDTVECWVLHVTIIYYTPSTVMRWWATITQHCYVMVCRLGTIQDNKTFDQSTLHLIIYCHKPQIARTTQIGVRYVVKHCSQAYICNCLANCPTSAHLNNID